MVDCVERRFDLRPQRLAGDTVYGAARLIKWLMDRKITPHLPAWTNQARPAAHGLVEPECQRLGEVVAHRDSSLRRCRQPSAHRIALLLPSQT
jgi:hypothetical protein